MSEMTARRAELRSDPFAPLQRMMQIRSLENRIQALFDEGRVRGTTHLATGQEAVAVALAAATETSDAVTCTYRGHAHAFALGVSIESVLGEILGRQSGCVGGMGGSMHLAARDVGLLPNSPWWVRAPHRCGSSVCGQGSRDRRRRCRCVRRRGDEHRCVSRDP